MFPACIKLTSSGIIFTGNIRCLDNMTVLKTQSPALAGTNEKLWLEKACCNLIPDLSLWIIEYAWSKRMMEVLEVLGPPLWLEGDWCLLTLEEPCQIRVVSAEVWRIVQARDIKHFERVTRFLDVSYLLVPRLVTPIKHMKIMFGLQTLSRKHMELMQKNREDFKSFAHALARDRSMREAYIRDLMEEQYGERYAQKLEERLSHYLEALDKALPQSTCIEQVLDQSLPQAAGEKILKKLLSRDSASLANVLRRLLNCAVTSNQNCDDSSSLSPSSNTCEEQKDAPKSNKPSQRTLHVVSRPSQDSKETRLSQTSSKQLFISQGLWQKRKESPQGSLTETCHDGRMTTSTQMSGEICQIGCSPSMLEERRWQQKHSETESETEQNKDEPKRTEQMCSRHGKKMKSILQECSEELYEEAVQALCTPTSSSKSTPPLFLHTSQPDALSTRAQTLSSPSLADSSSTNISLSYIQDVPSYQHQQSNLVSSQAPLVLQITSSSPSSFLQSSSKAVSKQHRFNAEEMREATQQVLTSGHNLKLSMESQSFLMKSRWLQPQVCLYRLSMDECARITHSSESDEEVYAFFDANTLYSDTYSDSDTTDSDDPDYNPKGG
ncbi:uncharacterized protein [Misgurnus anguillicaudatus]|uniref:uncharacterized protein isoform X2 n=1 Tax=Misgurnus anguillicaudatus TaxID=75329 RepID=UPI003CCF253C